MMEAAKYSAVERLRDGRQIEIRALQLADEKDMRAAVDRTSAQSLYRRFFGAKRHFSESEKAFFLNVDFFKHFAFFALTKTSTIYATSLCSRERKAELWERWKNGQSAAAMMGRLGLITNFHGHHRPFSDCLTRDAIHLFTATSQGS